MAMKAELNALDDKVTQLAQLCQKLRKDNNQLRQQLATAQSEQALGGKGKHRHDPTRRFAQPDSRWGRMSKEAGGLEVNVMGREFRVSCTEEERRDLLKAVDYLNAKMREIRDTGKVIGVERIAIMAALNITHEYLSTRMDGGFDVGEFKRRMLSMQAIIDQAMNSQVELF
jgi:cell division protein ZapA